MAERRFGRIAALTCAVALCPAARSAARDMIRLRDGTTVTGKVVAQTGEVVRIRTQGGVRTINRGDIQWMRGSRPKTRTGLGREPSGPGGESAEKASEGESE